ncbi:hypothetical protein [Rheinheimera sp.]|uniref:hypothetical protein n=1 Tax=Rheinheimera sp. TaxID=1869214 RepID=UPI003AF4FFB8
MKDLTSVHDYLLSPTDVGDWEGEEELVADKINAVFHALWQHLPDDSPLAVIDELMHSVWNELRGGYVLLEADEDELVDWALAYVDQRLEEGVDPDDLAEDDDEEE